jgi:hypothetical protein
MDAKLLLLGGGLAAYFLMSKKSKPSTTTKKDFKIIVFEKPYPSITESRKKIIDQEIFNTPVMFNLPVNVKDLIPIMDYTIWSDKGTTGTYQEWLAYMLYIQTAINEKEWDAETGTFPLYLECGKKLEVVSLEPPVYDLVDFKETKEECDARLLGARALLIDIAKYVGDKLPACPPGAKCE